MLFSWLKNKLNNLIPSDINDGMMTSNLSIRNVKIGTKITIPHDIVCFVNDGDKNCGNITEGTYAFDEKTFPKLYERENKKYEKRKQKIKKFQVDLDFVNMSTFTHELNYSEKVPLNDNFTKIGFKITLKSNVNSAQEFNDFVLSYYSYTSARKTTSLYLSSIEDFSRNFFKRLTLETLDIPQELKQKYIEKLTKELESIGVKLQDLTISLNLVDKFAKQKNIFNNSSVSIFDNNNISSELPKIDNQNIITTSFETTNNQSQPNNDNIISQTDNIGTHTLYDNQPKIINTVENTTTQNANADNNTKDSSPSSQFCPRCETKLIKGTKFCHRCGYQIY